MKRRNVFRAICILSLLSAVPVFAQDAPTAAPQTPASSTESNRRDQNSNRQDALQAYRNRQYQLAIDITLQEIKAQPDNMDSYAVLCWSMNALKRYSDSIRFANEARRYNTSDHRIVGVLAESYFANGDDQQAIAYFQQYVSMVSRIPGYDNRYVRDAYRDLADSFYKIGELHHADLALTAALAYDKGDAAWDTNKNAELWLRLGNIRLEAKDMNGARIAYNQALTRNPGLEAARTALAALPPAGL